MSLNFFVQGRPSSLTSVASQVFLLRIPFACTLKEIEISLGANVPAGQEAVFDVNAGATAAALATLFPTPADRPKAVAGTAVASKTGLNIALAKGYLTIDLDSLPLGGIAAPVFLSVTVEDNVPVQVTMREADGSPSFLVTTLQVGNGDLQDLGGGVGRLLTAADVILPTTLPPSGAAGGNLSGSYPNPTVESVNGQVPGSANGLAQLGADSLLLPSQLPAIALVERRTAASQAAMLALTDVQPGDFAFRTDSSEVYLLVGSDPSILANWVIWLHPAIPTTLPPSGSAGGDLGDTYPNPTVQKLKGDALPGSLAVANGFLKRDAAGTGFELVAYGSASNTVTQGNDSRLSDSRAPSGSAGGDLNGSTYPNPVISKIAGNALPVLSVANGFLKRNAAGNGWEVVGFGSAADTVTEGNDSRLSNSRTPSGSAGGDLTGTYPNPTVNQLKGRSLGGIPTVTGNFTDNFDDNSRDTTLWALIGGVGTNVNEVSNRLELGSTAGTDYRGYESLNNMDFRGKSSWVALLQVGASTSAGAERGIRWEFIVSGRTVRIWIMVGRVSGADRLLAYVYDTTNGFDITTNLGAWNSVSQKYLRLRHDTPSSTVYFDASPDGSTWTNLTSYSNTFIVPTACKVRVYHYDCTGTTIFDDFQTDVPLTDPITGQDKYALMWDNANNRFSILRTLGVVAYNASGSPPVGAPSNLPTGHTLMIVENTNPLKLWIWNVATSAWNSQQF
jgi:hypothetical protein